MSILFISSSQTYEEQSLIELLKLWLPNRPFEDWLSAMEIPYWGHLVSIEERGYYLFLEFCIRKSAHFVLFGLVAIGFYMLLRKMTWRTPLAISCTVVCAIADEYHQSLTGGRTPTFQDVILDTIGAIFFVTLVVLYRMGKRSA